MITNTNGTKRLESTDLVTLDNFNAITDAMDTSKVSKTGDTVSLASNGLTVGTNQLVVSGGNVGIGTSSPTSKLDVYGGSGNFRVGSGNVGVGLSSGTKSFSTYLNESDNSYRIYTNVIGDALTILSNGNVGIGTTNPSSKLHIVENAPTGFMHQQSGDTNYYFRMSSRWDFTKSFLLEANGHEIITHAPDTSVGLGFSSPGIIKLSTNSAERMRIDASGNVGIGTTSPAVKLEVKGGGGWSSSNYGKQLFVTSTYGTSNPAIAISDYFGGNLLAIGNNAGALVFNSMPSLSDSTTAPTERMRINSDGGVCIGTTVSSGVLTLKHSNAAWALVTHSTTSDAYPLVFYTSVGQAGNIYVNGTTTFYITSSDYRLKENVSPMQSVLSKLAQLKPCTYTWKADGSEGEGFIAHELQQVIPYAVTGEKDGEQMQGVDYSKLVPILTKAIQELYAEVQTLKGA